MKIKWFFDPQLDRNQANISLHPSQRHLVSRFEQTLQEEPILEVIDPQTHRKKYLPVTKILAIEAMDHLSKVYLLHEEVVYAKGRLKDFAYLADVGLVRINNTTIINLNEIESFQTERNACLSVYTTQKQVFRVSRHYVKMIRQQFLGGQKGGN